MFPKKYLTALFVFLSFILSSQTNLARIENKTITRKDLLKIQRITEFFPGLTGKIKFVSGSFVCKAGGDSHTLECKNEQLDKTQKELLTFSDVNTKIFIEIKFIDQSSDPEIVRVATAGVKVLE